ncbi:MAG: tryptophan synthase subunit alpha [Sphingobacteriia bacterium]|nr:MAG: tryptophan synthase subunit alpha [Sphingobacteriia bacterium]
MLASSPHKILNIYFTAGYPQVSDVLPILQSLVAAGVDIIEIGMPYSDPLADGPVIQESSSKALANGMTMEILFQQLKDFRSLPGMNKVGLVLMGYLNPVLQFGFEKFCQRAAAVGVDGIILPDLPPDAFDREYGAVLKNHGLDFSFLVTPQSSPERVKALDERTSGFLYAVSASATTGSSSTPAATLTTYLKSLVELNLRHPILVGFGIHDQASFDQAAALTRGGIVGSAFIRFLGQHPSNYLEKIPHFIQSIRPLSTP